MLMSYKLLNEVTGGFWNQIGSGTFGVVYKGKDKTGQEIAVKVLRQQSSDLLGNAFRKELENLTLLKHPNIVLLVGFCDDEEQVLAEYEGKQILATEVHRALCFEYLHNGSLQKHLSDVHQGFDWPTRYKIIKGICMGLKYLHMELRIPIHHLDLKPDNILLGDNMLPKIADFGISRLLSEETSKKTRNALGTLGYCPPEFINEQIVSKEFDIFSLGVIIIKIICGPEAHCHGNNKTHKFIRQVKKWRERLLAIPGYTKFDVACQSQQVKKCLQIALNCTEEARERRPNIGYIVDQLAATEKYKYFSGPMTEKHKYDQANLMIEIKELNILERIVAGDEEPSDLELSLLQSITANFSKQRKIGVGGCGDVYKGILRNGVVAVKKFFKSQTMDKMFHREIESLITVKHQNIVRFLGYCSFTIQKRLPFEGTTIMANIQERLLCFEYISNGSLENYLSDELRGIEWHIRYEIIVGICKGLLYLHKEKGIVHMDLKPSNILLDDRMVPKITDFGLSRLDNINSQTQTASRLISLGYCAPEYISEGKSSSKSDIYSLGVIITELVTGTKNEPNLTKVLRRWRHRWTKSSKHRLLGYEQVTKCLELAQRCKQIDPRSRPDIVDIIHELKAIDGNGNQFQVIPFLEDMLGIEPLKIHFPFELDQQISHSIELTNHTDDQIAFMTRSSSRRFHTVPDKGIVPPRSNCSVTVTMQAQVNALPNRSNHDKEGITVLSARVDERLSAADISRDVFIEKEGKVVDDVNVMIIFDTSASAEESSKDAYDSP